MVCLASILMMHPDVIVFDEPTSQLDPMATETLLNTVYKLCRENGITVIITEHRLESLIPIADRVIVIDEGEKYPDLESFCNAEVEDIEKLIYSFICFFSNFNCV